MWINKSDLTLLYTLTFLHFLQYVQTGNEWQKKKLNTCLQQFLETSLTFDFHIIPLNKDNNQSNRNICVILMGRRILWEQCYHGPIILQVWKAPSLKEKWVLGWCRHNVMLLGLRTLHCMMERMIVVINRGRHFLRKEEFCTLYI